MGNSFSPLRKSSRPSSPYSPTTSSGSDGSSINSRTESFVSFNSQDDFDLEPTFPLSRTQLEQIKTWREHHYLSKLTWGNDFSAPVSEWLKQGNVKVLDMGCGTGLWLIDVASKFPTTQFIGVDILPLIPKRYPPNVEFIQADIKVRLPFPDSCFDFIHMRHMLFYFTERDWMNYVIPELLRILKPGGFLELSEADIEWYNASPITKRLISAAHNVMRMRGIDPFIITRISEIMDNTQMFVRVFERSQESQIGKWAGEKGERVLKICSGFLNGIRVPQCKLLRVSEDEYDKYVNTFKEDVNRYKTYCKVHRFYAAKRNIEGY
uniref:Ubiquinone/menaquinone biosynthesis methyltransferase ubiE n=1 Tax=Anthurium amnicola TaxID=1678845 RepID=A0A1D1YNP8_9ARAE